MMLLNKNAVIYGAGGSLGGAVSRALAAAGARLFLSGHFAITITATHILPMPNAGSRKGAKV